MERTDNSIISDWVKEGVELNSPASMQEIVQCENNIQFQFPEDFRSFYMLCNGFKGNLMDSKFLSLWPLEKIIYYYPGGNFVPFCDYMINSGQIGFRKTERGIYRDYNETNLICNSFEEFLFHWRTESGEYI